MQCRDCAMTCHKKCVTKCQMGTVCTPHGSQRRASALPEDVCQPRGLELLVPPTQARRASAQPEIITTAAGDGDCTPQVSPWNYVVLCHSLFRVGGPTTPKRHTDFICVGNCMYYVKFIIRNDSNFH